MASAGDAPWTRCKGVHVALTSWLSVLDLLALRASCRAGRQLARVARTPTTRRLPSGKVAAWRTVFPHTAHVSALCMTQEDVDALEGVPSVDVAIRFPDPNLHALRHAHTVRLHSGVKSSAELAPLAGAHTLHLHLCRDLVEVAGLAGVRELSIALTPVESVAALSGVHTLDLAGCKHIRDLAELRGVRRLRVSKSMDLSQLGAVRGLHTLVAHDCDLERLPSPPEHTLLLGACPRFRDVALLRGLHTLDLRSCPLVTDVAPLAGLRRLNLSRCPNVVDVSALGGLDVLILSGCPVTDVSALGRVRVLDLSHTRVTDVSALGGVTRLSLSFTSVRDVSALGRVRDLNLGCSHVSDVSALGGVTCLSIDECPVRDVSALGGLHFVSAWRCYLIDDLSPLDTVCDVVVDMCGPRDKLLCSKHDVTGMKSIIFSWNDRMGDDLPFPILRPFY